MGIQFLQRIFPVCFAMLALLLSNLPACADEGKSALNHFVDGVEQFDLGKYQEALKSLDMALALEPDSLQFQYYVGLTKKAQGKDEEAMQIFSSIIDKDPAGFTLAYFELADIHSKNRRFQQAVDVLTMSEKVMPDNADVFLRKGLALKGLKEYDLAIQAYEKAIQVDATVTQAAYFNIAAVHFETGSYDAAEEMYNKAIAVDPNTPIAANARESLVNLAQAKSRRKPWFFSGSFAWGFDSNVPLDPLDMAVNRAPGEPTDKSDMFQVLQAGGGWKFLNRTDMEAGIGYEFRCAGYQEWTDNNLLAHRPNVYYRYNSDPLYFRIKYDYSTWHEGGEGWSKQDVFLLGFGNDSETSLRMSNFESTITYLEPRDMMSEVSLQYQYRDYADPANPDSKFYSLQLAQTFKLPSKKIYPRVGFRYINEDAATDASSYSYIMLFTGLSFPLKWQLQGDAAIYYGMVDFNFNPAYAAVGKREDKQIRFTASLTKPFGSRYAVKLYYDFTRNDSNVLQTGNDPFEFEKNVTSLMVTAAF